MELACLDGHVTPASEAVIPVTDDGFLRGDGVFEVVRVYGGRAFALGAHLDRLEQSAANLKLGFPAPRPELEGEADRLLAERGGSSFDGCLRIVLTRGGRRLLLTEPVPALREHVRLAYVTFAPTRLMDGIKSLSYAANMLAGRTARERGFDEAVLVTPHGRVLEAPTAALFYVADDGRLCTPPLEDHILASITRRAVLELTDVEERAVTGDELLGCEEAFLASTTREVQPVSRIEGAELVAPGERTREVAAALREHIRAALG